MRTNIALAALLLLLAVLAALGHRSSAARLAMLEARVEELDEALINVTVPMDLLRQDISGIYTELDALQRTEPSAPAPGTSAEATARQPRTESNPGEFSYRDSPMYRQEPDGYAPSSSADYAAGAYTGNPVRLPKTRTFHGASDEQG